MFIQSQQLRPPFIDYKEAHCLIFSSHQSNPGTSCLSIKESADVSPLVRYPCQKWTPTMNISLWLTLITKYGLRSLCPIAGNTCAFTRYPDQQPHPQAQLIGDAPRAITNGYRDPRGPTRPH